MISGKALQRFITNLTIHSKSTRVSQVRETPLQAGGVREDQMGEMGTNRGEAPGEVGDCW